MLLVLLVLPLVRLDSLLVVLLFKYFINVVFVVLVIPFDFLIFTPSYDLISRNLENISQKVNVAVIDVVEVKDFLRTTLVTMTSSSLSDSSRRRFDLDFDLSRLDILGSSRRTICFDFLVASCSLSSESE